MTERELFRFWVAPDNAGRWRIGIEHDGPYTERVIVTGGVALPARIRCRPIPAEIDADELHTQLERPLIAAGWTLHDDDHVSPATEDERAHWRDVEELRRLMIRAALRGEGQNRLIVDARRAMRDDLRTRHWLDSRVSNTRSTR